MKPTLSLDVIEKAIEGDAAAFTELYFALRDPIYCFVYRMLNDASRAEDISQEVFVFFIENSKKYDADRGSLFSFLCGVARNRVFAHLKKTGTRLEAYQDETDDFAVSGNGFGANPLSLVLGQELSTRIAENIAMLSPLQREAIILRELNDLTYEEIAEVTETDVNTVRSRLYRARRSLALTLAPYLINNEETQYEMRRS